MTQDQIEAYTQSLSALVTDEEFWQHQADGLALFACHGFEGLPSADNRSGCPDGVGLLLHHSIASTALK